MHHERNLCCVLRLARTSGGHLVNLSLVRQGKPGPVAQDCVQVTFVCLQGLNTFSLSPLALVAKAESLAVLLLANSTLGNQKLEGKADVSVGERQCYLCQPWQAATHSYSSGC